MVCRANTCKCAFLFKVKIFFKTCKSENIKVISGLIKISYLVFERSADLHNMLAVIIHGNVHLCLNMPREDILRKNLMAIRISYLECLP